MKRRIAVRGIVAHNNKLLCVKLKPYKGAIKGDFWCTLGGGVDTGEALVPALKREIIEEAGVVPVIGDLLYIQQFRHEATEHLEFFFHITNWNDFVNLDVSKTSHGTIEIATLAFIDPTKEHLLPQFLTTEDFSDLHNQPTKIFDYL
ncbi:MAG: hypothetical protein JWS12_653 [Candidatus Saccharibacteria bacterium]|nr:hypothetical protein [Candidatus Saccharibacteria bacterium]